MITSILRAKSVNRLSVVEFDNNETSPFDICYELWDLKLDYKDDNNWSLAGLVDGYASALITCTAGKFFSYHSGVINDTFFVDHFEELDFDINGMAELIKERLPDATFGPLEGISVILLRGE